MIIFILLLAVSILVMVEGAYITFPEFIDMWLTPKTFYCKECATKIIDLGKAIHKERIRDMVLTEDRGI